MSRLSFYLCPILLFAMTTSFTNGQEVATQQVIDLWNGIAPGSEDITDVELSEERGEPGVPNSWVTRVKVPNLTVFPASTKEKVKLRSSFALVAGMADLPSTRKGRKSPSG